MTPGLNFGRHGISRHNFDLYFFDTYEPFIPSKHPTPNPHTNLSHPIPIPNIHSPPIPAKAMNITPFDPRQFPIPKNVVIA